MSHNNIPTNHLSALYYYNVKFHYIVLDPRINRYEGGGFGAYISQNIATY